MVQVQIDINCDMGESYGNFRIGNDEAIFPHITSCNIACGFHGGDPLHIENTIKGALAHGLQIGAHPGYPDLQGFGRRRIQLKREELRAIIAYQIAALKGLTESHGGQLAYIKPHGALYNTATDEEQETLTIIEAIQQIDPNLKFMGLAGSIMEEIARAKEIPFIAEAFADRRYTADGKLQSRAIEGALIQDPEQAAEQVLMIATKNQVQAADGSLLSLQAQSICIHGDNISAIAILEAITTKLETNGVQKIHF